MQRLYVRLVGNQRGDLISFTSQREKDEKIKLKTPTKQFVLSFKNHTLNTVLCYLNRAILNF